MTVIWIHLCQCWVWSVLISLRQHASHLHVTLLPLVQNVSVERTNATLSLFEPLLSIANLTLLDNLIFLRSQVIIKDSEILQPDNWKRKS